MTIKSDFRGIFDPSSIEERNRIAESCYVPSKRRERYVDSVDRTLRAIIPPSEKHAQALDDSSSPKPIIKKLRTGAALTNQVLLLIGAAGAGKTTFVDHLRVKALPADVRRSTNWIHLNLNTAPLNKEEIYSWLRKEILKGIADCAADTDFEELDVIKKVFRKDVEKFRKGTGRLYEGDKNLYNQKLAEVLNDCAADQHYSAQAHCDFLSSTTSSLLVIVLDNCDKRLLEEQLLMFEAAQWLKTEFRVMVFLPLREETYDRNLSVPPLDTALKDLAFRIEAPRFDLILRERVDLAITELNQNPNKKFYYDLPNSMQATYTAADKISYLNSIMKSVFSSSDNIRRLLIGLSGRNMRRAMEIFLEFCSSGHISEDHILKIVSSQGAYVLPMPLVSQVLLRSKKRYYDSDYSYVVNLFSAEVKDDRPNFFVRYFILNYLNNLSPEGTGPRRDGYETGRKLLSAARHLGIREHMLVREVNYLAQHYCIVSEDFNVKNLTLDDLITISAAGRTHLYLVGNPYYIAAVAEDLWFQDEPLAVSIAERIKNPSLHYTPRTAILNADAAATELFELRNRAYVEADIVFNDTPSAKVLDLDTMENGVKRLSGQVLGKWSGVTKRYQEGSTVQGKITGKKTFGYFIQLEPGIDGLLHISNLSDSDKALKLGEQIKCIIGKISELEQKIDLRSC
ncbi:MAG: S1 RNA-binding domain-containing protein [Pseudomonadota bacterium]